MRIACWIINLLLYHSNTPQCYVHT